VGFGGFQWQLVGFGGRVPKKQGKMPSDFLNNRNAIGITGCVWLPLVAFSCVWLFAAASEPGTRCKNGATSGLPVNVGFSGSAGKTFPHNQFSKTITGYVWLTLVNFGYVWLFGVAPGWCKIGALSHQMPENDFS
jgi:hypothetical protein